MRENMLILRQKNLSDEEERINMDKFLAKVRRYKIRVNKKIQKKKDELKKSEIVEEEVEEDDDWIENEKLEKAEEKEEKLK